MKRELSSTQECRQHRQASKSRKRGQHNIKLLQLNIFVGVGSPHTRAGGKEKVEDKDRIEDKRLLVDINFDSSCS